MSPRRYIPALNSDRLTALYDPVMRWVMREQAWKRRILLEAQIRAGARVLDVGCGTGTLALMLAGVCPQSALFALDGDRRVLGIGRRKARRAGIALSFHAGLADALPYPSECFDRVVSSLLLHHLDRELKLRAAREAFRVLRPSGVLLVADFGVPSGTYARLLSLILRHTEHVADNYRGALPQIIAESGFKDVERVVAFGTAFGTLELLRGRRP